MIITVDDLPQPCNKNCFKQFNLGYRVNMREEKLTHYLITCVNCKSEVAVPVEKVELRGNT